MLSKDGLATYVLIWIVGKMLMTTCASYSGKTRHLKKLPATLLVWV